MARCFSGSENRSGGKNVDEQEKREQRMVNRAYFACAAIIVAGCLILGFLVALLVGFRFSADGAVGSTWRNRDHLTVGNYTVYYTLPESGEDVIHTFAAVQKSGPFYRRNSSGGKLVYPAGSDVAVGQIFSYQDGKVWHHVLLLNPVLPAGMDRQIDTLVVRGETIEVQRNSVFSTPRKFGEFTLDGVTFEVRAE